jgi:hypothetical protein
VMRPTRSEKNRQQCSPSHHSPHVNNWVNGASLSPRPSQRKRVRRKVVPARASSHERCHG